MVQIELLNEAKINKFENSAACGLSFLTSIREVRKNKNDPE
jgi:hypothetical protein